MKVAVVGCGTAGAAAALLLSRAGHAVTVFERVAEPGAVGAGILLQPSGQAVLRELGLLDEILACGSPVLHLAGRNARGRRVMALAYADWTPGSFGLGLHRGALFTCLFEALRREGVPLVLGVEITGRGGAGEGTSCLRDSTDQEHGPFSLVIVADGARSALRACMPVRTQVGRYPWGALWALVPDPEQRFAGVLDQTYRDTRQMLGFLPTGRVSRDAVPQVSLFWSMRGDAVEAWRARGMERFHAEMLRLDPRIEALLPHLSSAQDFTFASYFDVRMSAWHHGHWVCLGDAAHAMSPQLGQGANLALVDAATLARCVSTTPDVPAALAAYQRERRASLRYYQLATRWLTPFFQSSWPLLAWPRDLLMHPFGRLGVFRRQMLASLVGSKRGLLGYTPPD